MPKRRYSRRKNNAPVEDNTIENDIEFDNIGDGPLTKRMWTESEMKAADLSVDDTLSFTVHKERSTTTSNPKTVVLLIRRPTVGLNESLNVFATRKLFFLKLF